MGTRDPDLKSPTVRVLAKSVLWLREHGPHGLLKQRIHWLATDPGIEVWALSFLPVSVISLALPSIPGLLAIGAVRVYEIAVNAVHVTLFHGFLDKKPLAGNRRIVLLLLANYAEIVIWFGAAFRTLSGLFTDPSAGLPLVSLLYSLSIASGFGDPSLQHESSWVAGLLCAETALGLFMAIAVLARFVSLLPKPPK